MKTKILPKAVSQADPKTLSIEWNNGEKSDYNVAELRRKCVCAACVDEMTRAQILKPEDVPESTRPVRVRNMGRYALAIDWNDGHVTSIYSWDMLRKLSDL